MFCFSVSCSYKSRPTHTHKIDTIIFMNSCIILPNLVINLISLYTLLTLGNITAAQH